MTSKDELAASTVEEMELTLNEVNVINIRKNRGALILIHVAGKMNK